MASGAPTPTEDVPQRFHIDFTGRTLLGNYRIEKRLAEGGMGSVYLAEDASLSMRVVVKVPHARFLAESGFRGRFRREIAELVRLEHPHVVRILARGEEDEIPFFVLQFLGGGSLEDRLKSGPQAPAAVLAWLPTVARTLDYIHARGVVHRDVKPGNVLFDEQGHVFLSDFGLVKALGRDDGGEKTEAGTGVGSPLYMAPEQSLGRDVTGAADQYALATAVFEALAGEPPFGRGAVVEVLLRKQKGEPAPLRARAPTLSDACEAAIRRALSVDPAARFPSCTAFADAVVASLEPARAEAAPADRRTSPWVLLAAGAIVVAGAAAALGAFRGAPPPPGSFASGDASTRDILMLVGRGESPRRSIRRRGARDAKDRFEVVRSTKLVAPALLSNTDVDGYPFELQVTDVSQEGLARMEWRMSGVRAIAREPANRTASKSGRGVVGEVRGTAGLTAEGRMLDLAFKASRPEDARAKEAVEAVAEHLRSLEVVFPDEALGLGAEWNVSQVARVVGILSQETITYTLLSIVDERVRVRFRSKQSALPQRVRPPGMPSDVTINLQALTAEGEGTALIDLRQPAPLEFESKREIVMEIALPAATRATVTYRLQQEVRLRRE